MLALILSVTVSAQETLTLKGVKAQVKGTSTLHDWHSAITQINFSGNVQSENAVPKVIKNVKVTIPVTSIKSEEGKMMDNKTYEAFKSESNPNITYVADQTQITVDASKNITIKANGKLTMAGVTKPVTIEAKGKILANGNLQLAVSQTLDMREYNMKPPTVMMGTIKVGPIVTVEVDLILAASGSSL